MWSYAQAQSESSDIAAAGAPVKSRGGQCPFPMISRGKHFPRGGKLPWGQRLVQIIHYFPPCPPYSAQDIYTGEKKLGSVRFITRGSIVPLVYAGDAGHAVFEWGSYVLP